MDYRNLPAIISAVGLVSIPVIWIILAVQEKIKKRKIFRRFPIGIKTGNKLKFHK